MKRPFVVRIQCDDREIAMAIAGALEPELMARHARVRMIVGARGLRGATVAVGVRDEEGEARWVAPIEVSLDPAEACATAVNFLEHWGFLQAPATRRVVQ